MKKLLQLITIFLFFSGFLYAEEPLVHETNSPLFVSLGTHCEIAVKLRENNLRHIAYPFDWLVTLNHEGLITLLADDFLYFLDSRYFIQHPQHPHILENYYYDIEFRHDWPFKDFSIDASRLEIQLQEMVAKYGRRIERFRALKNSPNKVIFLRAAYDYENNGPTFWWKKGMNQISSLEAQQIHDALKQYFPQLDFLLVIINYTEENSPMIEGIEGVKEFKIRKSAKHEDYRALFNSL